MEQIKRQGLFDLLRVTLGCAVLYELLLPAEAVHSNCDGTHCCLRGFDDLAKGDAPLVFIRVVQGPTLVYRGGGQNGCWMPSLRWRFGSKTEAGLCELREVLRSQRAPSCSGSYHSGLLVVSRGGWLTYIILVYALLRQPVPLVSSVCSCRLSHRRLLACLAFYAGHSEFGSQGPGAP